MNGCRLRFTDGAPGGTIEARKDVASFFEKAMKEGGGAPRPARNDVVRKKERERER